MTFIDPFPASLLHLFISCFICEQHSSYLCNICDRELTFSHLVEACESSPIPCPHPSSLTCDSLTMETFSPRVRGGLELRGKKNKNLTTLCFLYHATSGNSLQLKALHIHFAALLAWSLIVNRRGRMTDETAGKLTRVYEASHLQWLLKIPPRLQHVLCKQVLAQQDKAWHFNLHRLPSLQGNFETPLV